MSGLYVSAAHKSSGKTLLTIGLAAALRERGRVVATFKKGPDYIDAGWLGLASGRACYNLDFHTMQGDELLGCLRSHAADADLTLVEGTKGLHDGVDADGRDSNAALAVALGLPVVLVLDTRGMTRGVAAMVQGLVCFDSRVRVAGVILNRVGGARHAGKLRQAVQTYCDCPVLGTVSERPSLAIDERHLGLVPGAESAAAEKLIAATAQHVAASVDLDALMDAGAGAEPLVSPPSRVAVRPDVRVAVAMDRAFNFYYADDLDAMRRQGAELVFFDTLRDDHMPDADALWIGGGFPETAMRELAANSSMRASIAAHAAAGRPVYAECGGLMYLARRIDWGGSSQPMCDVLPIDVSMRARPQGRGYMLLQETGLAPWGRLQASGVAVPAHEFHYSSIRVHGGAQPRFAYEVVRGHGIDGVRDGLVWGNVFASYAHLRDTQRARWVAPFLGWVRRQARQAQQRLVGDPV